MYEALSKARFLGVTSRGSYHGANRREYHDIHELSNHIVDNMGLIMLCKLAEISYIYIYTTWCNGVLEYKPSTMRYYMHERE